MPTSTLLLQIFDGTLQPFPPGTQVLVTITDGNQKQIFRDYAHAGNMEFRGLPFYDNHGDSYSVIAFVDGYKQAGYYPVKLSPEAPISVDLLLIPNDPVFNFSGLSWDAAKVKMPFLAPQPGESDADAQTRFTGLLETNGSKSLACMLNLVTAMENIDLAGRSPVEFIRQIRWDFKAPAQDRFFAYCDADLVDAVRTAALKGDFEPEHGCGLVHPGSTLSWKQVAFDEANVQLTFHTNPVDNVSSKNWVTVEPDIDYYKDLAAHSIMEVTRNQLTGSLTEPSEVFVLRWIEQRKLGLKDFLPGYTLRKD